MDIIIRFWRWIVAEVQTIATLTVNRRISGAPSTDDAGSAATSLAFNVSALALGALGVGGTYTASVYDQRGNVIVPDTGPAYESTDTSVFTVDPVTGAIAAVAEGTAVLIARLAGVRPGLFTVTVRQIAAIVSVPGGSPSLTAGGGMDRVATGVAVAGSGALDAGGTDRVAALLAVGGSTSGLEVAGSGTAASVAIGPSGAIGIETA